MAEPLNYRNIKENNRHIYNKNFIFKSNIGDSPTFEKEIT